MRRRLLAVVVGTVALALLVAALGTFALLRRDDSRQQRERLRDVSERLAANTTALESLDTALSALELTSASTVRFDPKDPDPARMRVTRTAGIGIPVEVTDALSAPDLLLVAQGTTVTRVSKGLTWSITGIAPDGQNFDALVLVAVLPDTARRAVGWLVAGSLAALLVAAAAAFLFARSMTKPLRAATGAYLRIASGDLSVRLGDDDARFSSRRDEIGDLVRSLDTMAASLERARRQERQFLLSVSHDLRTPLTSIRGFAEALVDGTMDDPGRAGEVIAAESRRLERLVRDLLDLAKLEARQFSLSARTVDLTDLVADAADGFLPTAERAQLTLDFEADADCSAVVDPERLGQVLANLIENAMKYARTRVVVGLHRRGGGYAITVDDDGPGIATEDLPHVFDRAYTSDRRPTREIGSGLGLNIVKELVQAMGATVTPTTSDHGTTFTVMLPSSGRI